MTTDSLREIVARAIYDAENGIDGDQIADMLYSDDSIAGPDAASCRAQVMVVCRQAADAALAAIEASGTHCIVPLEPTYQMAEAGGSAEAFTRHDWKPGMIVACSSYRAMLAARPRNTGDEK